MDEIIIQMIKSKNDIRCERCGKYFNGYITSISKIGYILCPSCTSNLNERIAKFMKME